MKKLMYVAAAALIAGCATSPEIPLQSPEVAPPAPEVAMPAPKVATPVKEVKPAAKSFKITDEQRAKMREQREKFMAERRAKMEAQILEVVKKYVPKEEKAKALVKELQDTLMAGRRNIMRRPMKPAAEAK